MFPSGVIKHGNETSTIYKTIFLTKPSFFSAIFQQAT